ncbi:MAG: hypothetical protein H0U13_17015 [Gemmatimonadaceae bacterium]|nr:hypothetical protein [Gemmatimonadaceae bacterium]
MTPAQSYRVKFGESLGATIQRVLDVDVLASHSDASEYADIAPEVIEAFAVITPAARAGTRRALRRARDWLRSRYGIREIILPEKYRVAARHDVVVTYSSCLALVYFARIERQLDLSDIMEEPSWRALYDALLDHPGIGLVATRTPDGIHLQNRAGRAVLRSGVLRTLEGQNPLELYGTELYALNAIDDLVSQPNAGDCVLFGAYDGYDIISFDDQVGAHGSAGGDQVYPFLIAPKRLEVENAVIENARDIHRVVMTRYAEADTTET